MLFERFGPGCRNLHLGPCKLHRNQEAVLFVQCTDERGDNVRSNRLALRKSSRRLGVGVVVAITWLIFGPYQVAKAEALTAEELMSRALELTRGVSSYSELVMRIQRPDWNRSSTIVAWTRGQDEALIRFTAPAKDAGNAVLKKGEKMWTFAPALKRSIRLPSSMMSQSWGGSDFSYNDLSRSDELLRYYDLSVVGTTVEDGHTIYTIDAVPHDDAPVVWGKETMVVRDDYVMLSQTYFDQSMTPIKRLETKRIAELGGRTIGVLMRMSNLEEPQEWTEIEYVEADFNADVADRKFTLFSLTSGR
mgnify:FL=1